MSDLRPGSSIGGYPLLPSLVQEGYLPKVSGDMLVNSTIRENPNGDIFFGGNFNMENVQAQSAVFSGPNVPQKVILSDGTEVSQERSMAFAVGAGDAYLGRSSLFGSSNGISAGFSGEALPFLKKILSVSGTEMYVENSTGLVSSKPAYILTLTPGLTSSILQVGTIMVRSTNIVSVTSGEPIEASWMYIFQPSSDRNPSVAVGLGLANMSTGEGSIALGFGNHALQKSSIALGLTNVSEGDYSFTAGDSNYSYKHASSIGVLNTTYGRGAASIGLNNFTGTTDNALNLINNPINVVSQNATSKTLVLSGWRSTFTVNSWIIIRSTTFGVKPTMALIVGANSSTRTLTLASSEGISSALSVASVLRTLNNTVGSIASGNANSSIGAGNIAMGINSYSQGYSSVAIGLSTYSVGEATVAIGSASYAVGTNSFAFGRGNLSIGYAISRPITSVDVSTKTIFLDTTYTNTAINSEFSVGDTVFIGRIANHVASAIITAVGPQSITVDNLLDILNVPETSMVYKDSIIGGGGIALGVGSTATRHGVTLGQYSRSIGNASVSMGEQTRAYGGNSFASGLQSKTYGTRSYAGGYASLNAMPDSLVHGVGSIATLTDNQWVNVTGFDATARTVSVSANTYNNSLTNFKVGERVLVYDNAGADHYIDTITAITVSGSTATITLLNSVISSSKYSQLFWVNPSTSPIAGSISIGWGTVAGNQGTISVGYQTQAMGIYSVAMGEGNITLAGANGAVALGGKTVATNAYQTVVGRWNALQDGSFHIGGGTGPSARENILSVSWNGSITIPKGSIERARYQSTGTQRSGKDAYGIFTTVTALDETGKIVQRSVLSGGTAPRYTTRTVTKNRYRTDGFVEAAETIVYALTYDSGPSWTSEVITSRTFTP